MKLPVGLAVGAVVCFLGAGRADADSTFCHLNYAPGTAGFATAFAAGFWLCADAGAAPGPGVLDVDSAGAAPQSAAQVGADSGAFSSANSNATSGLLHAFASATVTAPYDGITTQAFAAANASFFELGTLDPLGGAAPGTPVDVLLTIDVGGGFAGSGAGDGQVTVFHNGFVNAQQPIFVSTFDSTFFVELDLLGFTVGDSLGIYMILRAFAGASNQPLASTSSAADMSGSGAVFLDVTSGNALFHPTSGHDYSSSPVPEPAGAWLLGAAIAGLSTRARRR